MGNCQEADPDLAPWRAKCRGRLLWPLAAGLLFLSACAAAQKPLAYVEPAAVSRHYAVAIVSPVQKGTSAEVPAALMERTTTRLSQQLQQLGFSVPSGPIYAGTQDYILVKPTLEKYSGGSAFGRWLGFGAGTATCTLRVELIDGQSKKRVGDVAATQTIDSGGLFTIGAENYIVDRCADVVAKGIAEKLRPDETGR